MNKLDAQGILTEETMNSLPISVLILVKKPDNQNINVAIADRIAVATAERDALLELFEVWIDEEFPSYLESDGTISKNQFAIKFKRRIAKLRGSSAKG